MPTLRIYSHEMFCWKLLLARGYRQRSHFQSWIERLRWIAASQESVLNCPAALPLMAAASRWPQGFLPRPLGIIDLLII